MPSGSDFLPGGNNGGYGATWRPWRWGLRLQSFGAAFEQVYYPWQEIINSVPKSTVLDKAWPRLLSEKIIAVYEYFISLSCQPSMPALWS